MRLQNPRTIYGDGCALDIIGDAASLVVGENTIQLRLKAAILTDEDGKVVEPGALVSLLTRHKVPALGQEEN